ncbi:MAG: glycosyltransferase family 4 protein [Calditrichia bacterium]
MKRIAMVVYSYYPSDPRVTREALALSEKGYEVDIICLRGESEAAKETVDGITVYRLNMSRHRGNMLRYLWAYFSFLMRSFVKLSLKQLKKSYDIVHVHNMPDILVLSALLPKLMGAKIVLDLHDPMPEVFIAKFESGYSHPLIRLLMMMEKFSVGFSNLVLTPNLAFRDLFIKRGCPDWKIHIVMNSPVEEIFDEKLNALASSAERLDDAPEPFVVMYHGSVVRRHGLDDAVKAVKLLKDKIPMLHFNVFGGGEFVEPFKKVVRDEGVSSHVTYFGGVSIERIAREIARVDVGIIPNKRSPFTDINLPTRIFEYLSMKKPVIACRTHGIQDYFSEDEIHFFEPGNITDLARVIGDIYDNRERALAVMQRGQAVYNSYRWTKQKDYLVRLVDALLADGIKQIQPELPEDITRDVVDAPFSG